MLEIIYLIINLYIFYWYSFTYFIFEKRPNILYKSYGGVDSEVVGLYDNPAKVKPHVPHKMAPDFDRFCGRDTAVSIYSCGFTLLKCKDRSLPEDYIKGSDLYLYLGMPKYPGYSMFSTYKRNLDMVIPGDRVFVNM